MRLPNLTAATVISIATCIGIVRDAQAAVEPHEVHQQPFQTQPELASDVDFNAENHNTIKDLGEVVNLVCDAATPTTSPSPDLLSSAPTLSRRSTSTWTSPVTRNLQKQHAAGSDDSSSDNVEETDTDTESTLDSEKEDDVVEGTNSNDEKSDDEELLLDKKHHKQHDHGHHHHHKGGHHHGKHHHKGGHHRRHHHRNRPHHHRNRYEKKPIHRWVNRCVRVGTFCGTHIFGYKCVANAVYTCSKTGGKPKFTKACVGGCRNGECIITPAITTTNVIKTIITTTDGVTIATATTTTTSTVVTTTTKPGCVPLIEPLKDSIRNSLVIIEKLPLGPDASKFLKLALGTTLTAYFDNSVDNAGSVAALLAHTLPQIVDVPESVQSSLGPTFEISDGAFKLFYNLVDQIAKALGSLASCTGAKPDCTGLVVLSGYAIKIGVTILRANLTFKFTRK
ncbi:hypothetical protein BGX30_012677 [Mortierella sp. GBA39]|nr:hypothetical protein BGX30_012677 [Mortierella sp. GBA39]